MADVVSSPTSEQERVSQFAAGRMQAKQNRLRLAMQAPKKWARGTMLAASLGGGVSPAEQFQTEAAARLADYRAQEQIPGGLETLAQQGLLSGQIVEQLQAQARAIEAQALAAQSVAELTAARVQAAAFKQRVAGLPLGEKEREVFNEFREQIWRGLRISGPAADDATGGMTLGAGTIASYIIWIWSAIKGIRYRNEPEPITLTGLLSPPPMPLTVAAKDVGKAFKVLLTWFVDALGFLWNNFNLAIVVTMIAVTILFIIGLNCTINPLVIAEFNDVCTPFVEFVGSVATQ